jgi:hypothetical protein
VRSQPTVPAKLFREKVDETSTVRPHPTVITVTLSKNTSLLGPRRPEVCWKFRERNLDKDSEEDRPMVGVDRCLPAPLLDGVAATGGDSGSLLETDMGVIRRASARQKPSQPPASPACGPAQEAQVVVSRGQHFLQGYRASAWASARVR